MNMNLNIKSMACQGLIMRQNIIQLSLLQFSDRLSGNVMCDKTVSLIWHCYFEDFDEQYNKLLKV